MKIFNTQFDFNIFIILLIFIMNVFFIYLLKALSALNVIGNTFVWHIS